MFGQQHATTQPTTAKARVAQLLGSLPANDDILASDVDHMYEAGKIAEFNGAAAAVPVVTTTRAYAGTIGVSTCVAVLVRAKRAATLGLGCIHLSAIDMASTQTVQAALTSLWNELVRKLGGDPDANTCDLFAVGGADDGNTSWTEFERVLVGCQQLNPLARLAGAVIPVNGDDGSVEVYIEDDGVAYAFEGSDDT